MLPVLRTSCVGCHQPTGNSGASQTGQSFLRNRYVLTGNAEGDYNVTLTMVTDTCNAAANPCCAGRRRCRIPTGNVGQTVPTLAPGSAGYTAIVSLDHRRMHALMLRPATTSGGSAGRCPFALPAVEEMATPSTIRPPC